jgi:hypothetical protein
VRLYLERCSPVEFGRTKERHFPGAVEADGKEIPFTMILNAGGQTLELQTVSSRYGGLISMIVITISFCFCFPQNRYRKQFIR